MDCKLESAALSLMRIECIAIQGVLSGFINGILSVLAMPFIPFTYSWRRARETGGFKGIAMFPLFFVFGIWVALSSPFRVLIGNVRSLCGVARTEWANRWMASIPKKPNGRPLYIPTAEEDALLDAAIFRSVIRDYNEEAKRHGQGLDIPPLD